MEIIYNINKSKILHIHGSIEDNPILASTTEFSPLEHFGPFRKPNFEKPVSALKRRLEEWVHDQNIYEEPGILYVYGFNFNGRDREYLQLLLKKNLIKEIRFSPHQAKQIKNEEEKDNVYSNIKTILDEQIRPEPIKILDFEGESILCFRVRNLYRL